MPETASLGKDRKGETKIGQKARRPAAVTPPPAPRNRAWSRGGEESEKSAPGTAPQEVADTTNTGKSKLAKALVATGLGTLTVGGSDTLARDTVFSSSTVSCLLASS